MVVAGRSSGKLLVYSRDLTTGELAPLKTYEVGKSPAWVQLYELE